MILIAFQVPEITWDILNATSPIAGRGIGVVPYNNTIFAIGGTPNPYPTSQVFYTDIDDTDIDDFRIISVNFHSTFF